MKPRNWRTFFWYRPPSLACPAKTDEQCRKMADTYTAWLAGARGWSLEAARDYIGNMDRRELISAEHGDNSGTYQRKITWISAEIAVRVVPCFSREAHWPDGERTIHSRKKVRSAGVTVCWIMFRGRQVDAFLTAARAMEHARKLAA